MHRQRGGNSSGGMGRQAALLLVAAVALMLRGVGAKTQAMSGKMMNNPSMTGSHASDARWVWRAAVGARGSEFGFGRGLVHREATKVSMIDCVCIPTHTNAHTHKQNPHTASSTTSWWARGPAAPRWPAT